MNASAPSMTGPALHDAFLRLLSDGELRGRLVADTAQPHRDMSPEEWAVLSRLPKPRLIGLARFFARHYYRERIVRLFRYVRLMAPLTGRDPCDVLQSHAIVPVLDSALLGSTASARRMLAVIEDSLTAGDETIQQRWPFWRDLIRYQAGLFEVEAQAVPPQQQTNLPLRSPAARILDFEWDLPSLFTKLRSRPLQSVSTDRARTTLLLTGRSRGHVFTVRCTDPMRALLDAADGHQSVEILAARANLSLDDTHNLLQKLRAIGAVM